MSELLVNTIKKADGTGSLTVPAESGTVVTTASPSLGRRNLIINGAMQVAQRGTSFSSVTGTSYTLDRLNYQETGSAVVTITQESSGTRPVGFNKFARLEITTADSSTDASDKMVLKHLLETQDVHCLNYGTADAKDMTLSFWVRSSVSGTYSVAFYHQGSTSYSYTASYTISTADTWEKKTITVPGNTAQAHDNDDNVVGLQIRWTLAVGSSGTLAEGTWASGNYWGVSGQTNLSETLNATFDLTGVQLEVGSVATPFEHRSYGEELALCQRYFYRRKANAQYYNFAIGRSYSTTKGTSVVTVPQSMRANPTFSTSGVFTYGHSSLTLVFHDNTNYSAFTLDSTGAFTANGAYAVEANDAGVRMDFDAEL